MCNSEAGYTEDFSRLRSIVTNTLQLEIDDPDAGAEFWTTIYQERSNELNEIGAHFECRFPLCCVSGHVGTGKTTLIRAQFEKSHIYRGIYISLLPYETQFMQADDPGPILHTIISEHTKLLLTRCIMYCIHESIPLQDISYTQHPKLDLNPEQMNELNLGANIQLAAYILHYRGTLSSEKFEPLRVTISASDTEYESTFQAYQSAIENMSGPMMFCSSIFALMTYIDWLTLYRVLFMGMSRYILVFDNIDRSNLTFVAATIHDRLVAISNAINTRYQAEAKLSAPAHFKIIYAIRDENVSRIKIEGSAAAITTQLRLRQDDFRIPGVSRYFELTTDNDFISKVLYKRMISIDRQLDSNYLRQHFAAISNLWFLQDESTPTLSPLIAGVTIVKLSNYSIRSLSEIIAETTLKIIQRAIAESIPAEKLTLGFGSHWLKGRVTRAICNIENMNTLMHHFREEVRKECRQQYCAIHRILLTAIHNYSIGSGSNDHLITFRELNDMMEPVFQFGTPGRLKEALFWLFDDAVRHQGELITIYQEKFCLAPNDIHENARIRINSRGIELMTSIFISLDFFGGLLSNQNDKVLMEMTLQEAFEYVISIQNELFLPMAKNNMRFWCRHIAPRLKCGKNEPPFKEYARLFSWKYAFFSERVASSHAEYIRSYLYRTLVSEQMSNLFLCDEDMANTQEQVSNYQAKWTAAPTDEILKEHLKQIPDGHMVLNIWRVYEKYRAIEKKLIALHSYTRSDIECITDEYLEC
jgi:hypothetical protein